MSRSEKYLVWIDCEMTGLDVNTDLILEAAVVITNNDLEPVDEPLSLVIHQPEDRLYSMDAWCREQHNASGLMGDVRRSTHTIASVEQEILAYISYWCTPKTAPLCGNSVHQDRAFIQRWMPSVHHYLHYRLIDVSTMKELLSRWYPQQKMAFKKKDLHRALPDILESIGELAHYRDRLTALTTQNLSDEYDS